MNARFTPMLSRYSAHIVRYADGKFVGLVRTPNSLLMRTPTYTNATRPKFDILKWYSTAGGTPKELKWFSWSWDNAQGIFNDSDGLDHSAERIYAP